MNILNHRRAALCALASLVALTALTALPHSATSAPEAAGVTAAVLGDIDYVSVADQKIHRVKGGEDIFLGDEISSSADSSMQLMLLDETIFTIGPETDLTVDEFVYDPATGAGQMSASLTKGVFRFVAGSIAQGDPEDMEINLPIGTIGIRGTSGIVQIIDNQTPSLDNAPVDMASNSVLVVLLETGGEKKATSGLVISSQGRSVELTVPGYGTVLSPDRPPVTPFVVDTSFFSNQQASLSPSASKEDEGDGEGDPAPESDQGDQADGGDGGDGRPGEDSGPPQGDGPVTAEGEPTEGDGGPRDPGGPGDGGPFAEDGGPDGGGPRDGNGEPLPGDGVFFAGEEGPVDANGEPIPGDGGFFPGDGGPVDADGAPIGGDQGFDQGGEQNVAANGFNDGGGFDDRGGFDGGGDFGDQGGFGDRGGFDGGGFDGGGDFGDGGGFGGGFDDGGFSDMSFGDDFFSDGGFAGEFFGAEGGFGDGAFFDGFDVGYDPFSDGAPIDCPDCFTNIAIDAIVNPSQFGDIFNLAGTANYGGVQAFFQTFLSGSPVNIQGTVTFNLNIDFDARTICASACSITVDTTNVAGNINDSTAIAAIDYSALSGPALGVITSADIVNPNFLGTTADILDVDNGAGAIVANNLGVFVFYDDGVGNTGETQSPFLGFVPTDARLP